MGRRAPAGPQILQVYRATYDAPVLGKLPPRAQSPSAKPPGRSFGHGFRPRKFPLMKWTRNPWTSRAARWIERWFRPHQSPRTQPSAHWASILPINSANRMRFRCVGFKPTYAGFRYSVWSVCVVARSNCPLTKPSLTRSLMTDRGAYRKTPLLNERRAGLPQSSAMILRGVRLGGAEEDISKGSYPQ